MKKSSKSITVGSLAKKLNKGEISLKHKLQRKDGVWNRKMKSLLIDSMLREYIIPAIYLVIDSSDNKKHAIDGVQRLSTIRDYLADKFSLCDGLKPIIVDGVEYEISKKKFSKLDEKIQDLIKDCNVVEYDIAEYTDEEIRDMFARLNAGKPLNSTQKLTSIMSDEVIDSVVLLSNNLVFDKLLSHAQLKSSTDISVIIESLMLIESSSENDFVSFKSKTKSIFITWLNDNINDDKVAKLDEVFTLLSVFLTENEDVKIQKTSVPMIVYAIYKAKKDHKSVERLMDKIKDFVETYDNNEEYKSYVVSGTSSPESVKNRTNYWRAIVNKL